MITDRNISDIENALILIQKMQSGQPLTDEERAAFFAGLRGCYNISDLNRVESKVNELSALLNANGYNNVVITKTWTGGEIMRYSDIARYLGNITALRGAISVKDDTPDTPAIGRWLDYVAANETEQILVDVEELIAAMNASAAISGTFYSGARRALPLGRI
ncbi:MAG: hypothetical protein LBQ40_04445 [Clostridiales bacterium]|nr:hypothetical protein [Clostridiales bacterium]